MEMYSFDDLENLSPGNKEKPFFAIDLTNEDTVLNWLKDELWIIKSRSTNRLEKAKNNYLRYKGLQYFNAVYYPRDVLETQKKYTPQLVLPLISDAIDEKVARILESKPQVAVLPQNYEREDKIDAKVAKKFLSHIDHDQKMDNKYHKILKNSQITGESFLWTKWNPDLGEKLSDSRIAKTTEDGQKVFEGLFQGDVEITNKTCHWVFYEEAESWEKVNYCYVVELDYVEALKLDYPDKADKITEDVEARVFDFDNMDQTSVKGQCRKIHFYHKKTKYLPDGYEATFVTAALLKGGPLSYDHGDLPIDRLVAIENDEEIHGQSPIDKLRGIASNANNLLNAMVKMFMLAGHAKWFIEAGSVDDQSLNNDVNIVKMKPGSRPPALVQANPVGQGHFEFVDKFIGWFYKFAKSNSVIQGNPPPGVTAGVALQYVSESESRRLSTDVSNFNALVRAVNEKALKVCGQYYRPDDERTVLIVGKDNRWEQEPLNIAAIGKSYSVQIQNTSGLSDSKAVRTQQILDLGEKYPDLLSREQIVEMTGLGQADKAYDVASVAARAAEDENEQMCDTGTVIEPTEYEDLITHWRIHAQEMQPLGFKQKASPQVQKAMNDHLMATENMMIERAIKSPPYMQSLTQLVGFPMLAPMPLQAPPPPLDPITGAPLALPNIPKPMPQAPPMQ